MTETITQLFLNTAIPSAIIIAVWLAAEAYSPRGFIYRRIHKKAESKQ